MEELPDEKANAAQKKPGASEKPCTLIGIRSILSNFARV